MQTFLAQLKQINQLMLELANNNEWEKLAEKSKKRQQLLEQKLPNLKESFSADKANQLFALIENTDNKINQLIKASRQSFISQSINLKNAQSALKAYRANR